MKRLTLMAAALGVLAIAIMIPATAKADDTTQAPSQEKTVGPNYVDQDGDGICDNCKGGGQGQRAGKGGRGGHGPGDGSGNQGAGPKDGTGYGPGGGSGNCDGTGPKGQGQGRGRSAGRR